MNASNDASTQGQVITLAILGEQIKTANITLARIERLLSEHIKDDTDAHSGLDVRTRSLENGAERRGGRIDGLEKDVTELSADIDNLRQKDTWGGIITGALASLGIALGIFKQ